MSDGVSSLTVLSVDKTRKLVRARATTDITLEEQRFVYLPGAAIDQSAVLYGVEKRMLFCLRCGHLLMCTSRCRIHRLRRSICSGRP